MNWCVFKERIDQLVYDEFGEGVKIFDVLKSIAESIVDVEVSMFSQGKNYVIEFCDKDIPHLSIVCYGRDVLKKMLKRSFLDFLESLLRYVRLRHGYVCTVEDFSAILIYYGKLPRTIENMKELCKICIDSENLISVKQVKNNIVVVLESKINNEKIYTVLMNEKIYLVV